MYILNIESLSPSREYCKNPISTCTLNLVCNTIFINCKFLPQGPV